jgi:hypothetical protein
VGKTFAHCRPGDERVIVNFQPLTLKRPRLARQKEEFFIMSTGQQHHTEQNTLSFELVNAHVNKVDLAEVTAPAAVPQSNADRASRLITAYAAARPILSVLAATPLIPATWRAIVATLVLALDQVTNSFKAGKDLAVGDGDGAPVNTMEPKLPA